MSAASMKTEEKPIMSLLCAIDLENARTCSMYAHMAIYESDDPEGSRRCRWSDINGIGRTGHYQFGVTTYEPEFGGPSKTYNFDLKEQMDERVYDYLWTRVYKVRLPTSINEQLAGRPQP